MPAAAAEATTVDEREQGGAWERRRRPWRHSDGDGELGVGDDVSFAERSLDFLFYLQLGPFLFLFLLFNSSSSFWILFGALKQFRKIDKYL